MGNHPGPVGSDKDLAIWNIHIVPMVNCSNLAAHKALNNKIITSGIIFMFMITLPTLQVGNSFAVRKPCQVPRVLEVHDIHTRSRCDSQQVCLGEHPLVGECNL